MAWETSTYQTPSTLTYHKGKLLWGAKLERLVRRCEIPEAEVLRHFKLTLHTHESLKTLKEKVEVIPEKHNKTIYDLYADYMHELVATMKRRVFNDNILGPAYNAQTIPVDIIVGAPQSWSPQENRALIEAAKKLGMNSCTVVGEALCAAAFHFTKDIDVAGERWLQVGN